MDMDTSSRSVSNCVVQSRMQPRLCQRGAEISREWLARMETKNHDGVAGLQIGGPGGVDDDDTGFKSLKFPNFMFQVAERPLKQIPLICSCRAVYAVF